MAEKIGSEELAKKTAEIALDKKATDVVIIDLRGVSDIADFFVLASAGSNRLLHAVREFIIRGVKKNRKKPLVEGENDWVLLDYGDVIIHLFTLETRDYYQIERLWKEAKKQEVESRE